MAVSLTRAPTISEHRTPGRLWDHYNVERSLAAKLRSASRPERRKLYSTIYEELFRRVPDHPQLVRKVSQAQRAARIADHLGLLQPFLAADTSFLEIGAGDCSLALALASRVKRVYAVDVSEAITRTEHVPANFELILSDGVSVPVAAGSIDFAYSNQLMEHLHPDDALEQLENIHRALAPGGLYFCVTPNRLTGPHDISRYFDTVASGLHLKEYTITELRALLHTVGFRRITHYVRHRLTLVPVPEQLARTLESGLCAIPAPQRARVCHSRMLRKLLDIHVVAQKQAALRGQNITTGAAGITSEKP